MDKISLYSSISINLVKVNGKLGLPHFFRCLNRGRQQTERSETSKTSIVSICLSKLKVQDEEKNVRLGGSSVCHVLLSTGVRKSTCVAKSAKMAPCRGENAELYELIV